MRMVLLETTNSACNRRANPPLLLLLLPTTLRRAGADELAELRRKVEASYHEQTDVRYAAARLWVDAIVEPAKTRAALLTALAGALRYDDGRPFRTGVLQV
jgi:3-methylcrotonyl-CoA carboxylase beta subunit